MQWLISLEKSIILWKLNAYKAGKQLYSYARITFDSVYMKDNLVDSTSDLSIGNDVSDIIFAQNTPKIVEINAVDLFVNEGATASLRVSRKGDTSKSQIIKYLVRGSAKYGVDYQPLSGRITIPAGSESALINIPTIPDGINEGTETILVSLENEPHVYGTYMLGPDFHAMVNIVDGPAEPIEGDANEDWKVDVYDLALVGLNFGKLTGFPASVDVKQGGGINIFDLNKVVDNFLRLFF